MKKKSLVALVLCRSYEHEEVRRAVRQAVRLLGGIDQLLGLEDKTAEVLLKPNMLRMADPGRCVTTHPEVFRAVGELLQDEGYTNLAYGDSPGHPIPGMLKTAEGCGIKAVADHLGIRAGDFEQGTEVECPGGKAAKHFVLCNEVIKVLEADPQGAIINICKMKTHQLERITGAVKNTFGCICGINKTASHAKFESPEYFARMVADLNTVVKPKLHIMDGVVAMEGNGPSSGDPVQMDAILASTDPVALDTVFCHLIALDEDYVPTNAAGRDAGVGTCDEAEIEVVLGSIPMQPDGKIITPDEAGILYGDKQFNVQRSAAFRGGFKLLNLVSPLISKKPVVISDSCIGCGVCEETCPVEGKAIKLHELAGGRKVAAYDYSKCIKCYCCQEMCPARAITIKKSLLAKIIDRKWKI